MAAVVSLAASVLLVLSLFDTLGGVRSAEMRTEIENFLARPPGDGLGLSAGQIVEILRVLVFVTAGVATAVAVLSVFVLQRHRGARIGFTVAAGLLLLTAPVSGLLPFLVAVGAALLWSAPARAWFAGRPSAVAAASPPRPEPTPSDQPRSDQAGPDRPPSDQAPAPADQPAPRSHSGFGGPVPPGPPDAPTEPPPYPTAGYPAPPAYSSTAVGRPVTVTIGVVLTWLATTVVGGLFALVAVMLAVAGDQLLDEVERDPTVARLDVSRDQLTASLWVGVAVVLVWCAAAFALAVLTFLGKGWARILLTVSGGVAAVGSLLAGVVGVFVAVLVVPALVLLYVGGANGWFARRPPQPFPQPPSHSQPPYPPPPPTRPGPW